MLAPKHLSWWSLHRDKKKKKTGERAALSLHTPQNSWKPIQVSGAIPKRSLWSSEESWDSQVIMWLREDEVKEKTMDRSSTSPLGHFRDFFKCVCECIRPSCRLLADEEALHKDLWGTRSQRSALSHAYAFFSDAVEFSRLSADTQTQSIHALSQCWGLPVGVLERMEKLHLKRTKDKKKKQFWILSQKRLEQQLLNDRLNTNNKLW